MRSAVFALVVLIACAPSSEEMAAAVVAGIEQDRQAQFDKIQAAADKVESAELAKLREQIEASLTVNASQLKFAKDLKLPVMIDEIQLDTALLEKKAREFGISEARITELRTPVAAAK